MYSPELVVGTSAALPHVEDAHREAVRVARHGDILREGPARLGLRLPRPRRARRSA